MRIRATVAAVSGALALSALAVPVAQADGSAASAYRADIAKVKEAAHSATSGKSAFSTAADEEPMPYKLNASFSNFKIAKTVKLGTTGQVSVPVSFTLTHGTEVDITADDFFVDAYIYRGSFTTEETESESELFGEDFSTCTATSATVATCKGDIDIYLGEDVEILNSQAGTWRAAANAVAINGQASTGGDLDITKIGFVEKGGLATTLLQRASRLTVNATPEPVKKGKTITVTGKLTRANWDALNYGGYAAQPVKLQFRKNGASTYTTVKTIKTTTKGDLKTTVKATADGFFRYVFAGTTTTSPVSSATDFIDVK
ncbi:hypothetical protein [Streptomyces sp. SID12501]|uniref:Lipoprotein n=1 Tax=Streptomyces sp. SID12501 TaxID=2706042 RepID=A0A6B3BXP8_9ACTN|nr:hypothetical protein [Streptomyces sp. SID12501]NEC89016.1 hypothetical protein [Streptomyces sp. SID12501]